MTSLPEPHVPCECLMSISVGTRPYERVTLAAGKKVDACGLVSIVSGDYVPFDPNGSDGSEKPVGVAYGPCDATEGEQDFWLLVRDAVINANAIDWPDGITGEQKSIALGWLAENSGLVTRGLPITAQSEPEPPSYVGPLDLVPGAASFAISASLALSVDFLGETVLVAKRDSDGTTMDSDADAVTGIAPQASIVAFAETTFNQTGDTEQDVADVVLVSGDGILPGQRVSGDGIQAGTIVAGIVSNTVTLSLSATATASGVQLTFTRCARPDTVTDQSGNARDVSSPGITQEPVWDASEATRMISNGGGGSSKLNRTEYDLPFTNGACTVFVVGSGYLTLTMADESNNNVEVAMSPTEFEFATQDSDDTNTYAGAGEHDHSEVILWEFAWDQSTYDVLINGVTQDVTPDYQGGAIAAFNANVSVGVGIYITLPGTCYCIIVCPSKLSAPNRTLMRNKLMAMYVDVL